MNPKLLNLNLKFQENIRLGLGNLNFLHKFFTKTFRLDEPDFTWLFPEIHVRLRLNRKMKPEPGLN